jgi:hypothetical protein
VHSAWHEHALAYGYKVIGKWSIDSTLSKVTHGEEFDPKQPEWKQYSPELPYRRTCEQLPLEPEPTPTP